MATKMAIDGLGDHLWQETNCSVTGPMIYVHDNYGMVHLLSM